MTIANTPAKLMGFPPRGTTCPVEREVVIFYARLAVASLTGIGIQVLRQILIQD